MDRFVTWLTASPIGRYLSAFGNANILGAGLGAILWAAVAAVTPLASADWHVQVVSLTGGIVAGAALLGIVRNLVVARIGLPQAESKPRSLLGVPDPETLAEWRQRIEDEDRRELFQRYTDLVHEAESALVNLRKCADPANPSWNWADIDGWEIRVKSLLESRPSDVATFGETINPGKFSDGNQCQRLASYLNIQYRRFLKVIQAQGWPGNQAKPPNRR